MTGLVFLGATFKGRPAERRGRKDDPGQRVWPKRRGSRPHVHGDGVHGNDLRLGVEWGGNERDSKWPPPSRGCSCVCAGIRHRRAGRSRCGARPSQPSTGPGVQTVASILKAGATLPLEALGVVGFRFMIARRINCINYDPLSITSSPFPPDSLPKRLFSGAPRTRARARWPSAVPRR